MCNFFDQPIKSDMTKCNKIRRIAIDQGDDYTTGYLLDDPYLKELYKMIAIDLSKQLVLDTDPITIPQINFTENKKKKIEMNSFLKKQNKLF